MLSQKKIEAVMKELARQQGHELTGQEKLIVRTQVSGALAAKERHRQRVNAAPYQWIRKAAPRKLD